MSTTSNWFEISAYGSFRWVDNNITSPYNTLPLDSSQDDLSFCQQVQCGGSGYQSDIGQIQVLSSFVPTCKLCDYNTDQPVKTVTLTAITPPILNVDFIGYNGQCDFSDVDPGLYYLKITYTDQNSIAQDWRTSPLDVEIYHEGTQLIEATNTYNDKGAIFVNADGSLIITSFRVSSMICDPIPKTDAQDYEDQYNELTQETSIPYLQLTQRFGDGQSGLLPLWVIEKINLLYSLNQITVDGNPIAKLSTSEFKPIRSDIPPQGAFWQVDIQPNNSYPNEVYQTGPSPGGDEYIVVKKCVTYTAQSANFACTGVFTSGRNLIRIAVVNNTDEVFTMLVGTSEGDDSLGTINFPDDDTDSIDIGKYFKTPTDVWISGIAGCDLDITFDFNDYLATAITPPSSTSNRVKNELYWYSENTEGDFVIDWDITTGLGNVGTDFEGCILAGRGGTQSVTGMSIRGWDNTEIFPLATRGTIVGADDVTLDVGNIPDHTHFIANNDVKGPGSGFDLGSSGAPNLARKWSGVAADLAYDLQGSSTTPDRGNSSLQIDPDTGVPSSGPTDPFSIIPHSLILAAFYYIGI